MNRSLPRSLIAFNHVSESTSHSMEAFAKKKGKVGTRGGGQIIRENEESLVFYRFVHCSVFSFLIS